MSCCKKLLFSSLLLLGATSAWAVEPRYRIKNDLGWDKDFVVDVTSMGDATGVSAAWTNLASCGMLATDSGGNVTCQPTPGGTGDITAVGDCATGACGQSGTLTLTGNVAATNTVTGTVVVDTPRLENSAAANSGNVLVQDSLNSSATVTGVVVHARTALQVGSDYLSDITGSGLSISNGALTASGGTNHNLLSATHSDSSAASATRGDLIVANSSPAWARFGVGGSNTVLTANGTDPAWSATPTVTNLTATNTVTGTIVVDTPRLENSSAGNSGAILVQDSLNSSATVTGVVVVGTSILMIPSGSNPTITAPGAIGEDTTDGQFLYGATPRVIPFTYQACAHIDNVVASDDNLTLWMNNDPVTITEVGCRYDGTGSTVATFALEDASGNAMTHSAPTCVTTTTSATYQSVTAANSLTAGEGLRVDTTNTPAPTTDDYTLCWRYTVDRQ